MNTPKKDTQTMTVSLNPEPKGEFKILGGSRSDDWNLRLSNLVVGALPIQQSSNEAVIFASGAINNARDANAIIRELQSLVDTWLHPDPTAIGLSHSGDRMRLPERCPRQRRGFGGDTSPKPLGKNPSRNQAART